MYFTRALARQIDAQHAGDASQAWFNVLFNKFLIVGKVLVGIVWQRAYEE
jgi:hypothetical protein